MATLVVKFGGSAFSGAALAPFCARVRTLVDAGDRVVVVHGGGKEITRMLDRLGKPARFLDGLRVTDDETLDTTEQVLSGRVNKAIVRALAAQGVNAVGVAGTDGGLITAEPLAPPRLGAPEGAASEGLGHVGRVAAVDPRLLRVLVDAGYVAVVSPLALGGPRGVLNVNADTAAAALAGAVGADAFLLVTDVPGVLVPDPQGDRVAPELARSDVERLKRDGTIRDGMVPKADACLAALDAGARSARVLHADDFAQARPHAGTRIHQG